MDASRVPASDAPGDHGDPRHHLPLPSTPTSSTFPRTTSTPGLPGATSTAPGSGLTSTTTLHRSIPAAKPSLLFQNKIPADCHSLVTSSLGPVLPPGELWVTRSSLLNLSATIVANMLNYFFAAPPERFSVSSPSPGVFYTRLASRNVANIILSRGAQKLGPSVFTFHASQNVAEVAVHHSPALGQEPGSPAREAKVQPEEDDATAQLSRRAQCSVGQPASGPDATLLWQANSRLPPILSKPRVPPCMPPGSNASSAAPWAPAKYSFRDALLRGVHSSPEKPSPSSPTPPTIHPNACFRCFATDHHIHACQEPIRCRNCGRLGHR
jgi:hypothetical protein